MYGLGFEGGNASQCVFVFKERDITKAVYGDEFTSAGRKSRRRRSGGGWRSSTRTRAR